MHGNNYFLAYVYVDFLNIISHLLTGKYSIAFPFSYYPCVAQMTSDLSHITRLSFLNYNNFAINFYACSHKKNYSHLFNNKF